MPGLSIYGAFVDGCAASAKTGRSTERDRETQFPYCGVIPGGLQIFSSIILFQTWMYYNIDENHLSFSLSRCLAHLAAATWKRSLLGRCERVLIDVVSNKLLQAHYRNTCGVPCSRSNVPLIHGCCLTWASAWQVPRSLDQESNVRATSACSCAGSAGGDIFTVVDI